MIRHSETLARIPLFRSLHETGIQRLDGQCVWRRAKANEWIVDYDEGGTDLFFVAQGHVRVRIRAISGRETILRDIHDGEYFGELAAIDGRRRSAGIQAVTNSVIARMAPAVFRSTIHAHPDVCDQLLALLASQIRSLTHRVNEYGTLDVRHRIYAELLRLARPLRPGEPQAIISPPPTHAELAGRVSTRREAVTRELNSLARIGMIERRRGALILLDPQRLAELVEEAGQ
jgi:CRP/FNR family cyclic AMP-dependent transcriptional regulator